MPPLKFATERNPRASRKCATARLRAPERHLALRVQIRQALRELRHRHVDGARETGDLEFPGLAHVEQDGVAAGGPLRREFGRSQLANHVSLAPAGH
jgi:hypothetical protein